MSNIIPPMTDPMGKNWVGIPINRVEVNDTHAIMAKVWFDLLAEYSSTIPSGVYAGKMWKRHDGVFDANCKPENRKWLLCWFVDKPNSTGICLIEYRIIILKEMLDLIID